jgi:hypothetical protein
MKWHFLVALGLLASTWAIGQAVPRGAASAPEGGRSSAQSDSSGDAGNDMHLKSMNEVLQGNPKLANTLQELLPANISPQQACNGYKTLEQCVTAVHLASDVKISFSDLKTTTTGKHPAKLEKAVAQLASGVDAGLAVKKAHSEAGVDMKGISLFSF